MKSKTKMLKKSKYTSQKWEMPPNNGRYLPKNKIPSKKKWKALMLIRHQVLL
jgi:hypothetical protein